MHAWLIAYVFIFFKHLLKGLTMKMQTDTKLLSLFGIFNRKFSMHVLLILNIWILICIYLELQIHVCA